jgi:hypothetical protein
MSSALNAAASAKAKAKAFSLGEHSEANKMFDGLLQPDLMMADMRILSKNQDRILRFVDEARAISHEPSNVAAREILSRSAISIPDDWPIPR